MSDPTLTAPPAAPQPADPKGAFNQKAFSFFGWFAGFITEMQAAISWMKDRSTAAGNAAQSAGQSAQSASGSAASAWQSATAAGQSEGNALTYAQAAGASAGIPPPGAGDKVLGLDEGTVAWVDVPNDRSKLDAVGGVATALGYSYKDHGVTPPAGTLLTEPGSNLCPDITVWTDMGGFAFVEVGRWGSALIVWQSSTGTGAARSEFFPLEAGQVYTLSYDAVVFGEGRARADVEFFDAAGNLISRSGTPAHAVVSGDRDFSVGDGERLFFSVTTPAGTTQGRVRAIREDTAATTIGIRQLKLEKGPTHTGYSPPAGVVSIRESDACVHKLKLAGSSARIHITDWMSAADSRDVELLCENFGGKTVIWPAGFWIKSDGSFAAAVGNSGVTWQASGVDRVLAMRDAETLYYKVMR